MKKHVLAMRTSGFLLAFFAFIGVLFVSVSHLLTKDKIAENQRMLLQHNWNEVLDVSRYSNDLNNDNRSISAEELDLPYDSTVYLARSKSGKPVAAIFRVTTLEGYGGRITLLVSVNYKDKHITGVRVINHTETPGLGDKIEIEKSKWILGFNDKFLNDETEAAWAVKRDGGEFDQFTGATITPRAVVGLVKHVLDYANNNMSRLFSTQSKPQTQDKEK